MIAPASRWRFCGASNVGAFCHVAAQVSNIGIICKVTERDNSAAVENLQHWQPVCRLHCIVITTEAYQCLYDIRQSGGRLLPKSCVQSLWSLLRVYVNTTLVFCMIKSDVTW